MSFDLLGARVLFIVTCHIYHEGLKESFDPSLNQRWFQMKQKYVSAIDKFFTETNKYWKFKAREISHQFEGKTFFAASLQLFVTRNIW